jgi:2-keto-3-deoxy-L-rhamnonate aldolase RhmA
VEIVEMLAAAGFEAVILDLEHGPIDVADLPVLCAATQGAGLYALVRVRDATDASIAAALDAGADGVLVPHVATAADARAVVAAARFPPEGTRSINPYVRGNHYGRNGADGYTTINGQVAVLAMLEGQDALDELDAITATDGLDAVFVGPVDFSASVGLPGQAEHPEVVSAVREILSTIHDSGLATGIYAPSPEAASRWFRAGVVLVALSADSAMALGGFARTVDAVDGHGADDELELAAAADRPDA